MLNDNLAELGLSPLEIKVYLFLLKNGASYANEISVYTQSNRSNVYEALGRLCSKALAYFVKRNNVKMYQAKPPESLLGFLKVKEDGLQKMRKSLAREVPMLKKSSANGPYLEAGIFVGSTGLKMLLEEILDAGKTIYLIAAEHQLKKLFGTYFEIWHAKRIKKAIFQKSIFPKRFKGNLPKRKFLQYAFVDDSFTNPTTTIIYGDNCILIQWSAEPLAIKIENKAIAKTHLNYFNQLWNP